MNFLSLFLKFFPAVLNAVVAVEAAISAPGATKKQIVLNSIVGAARSAGAVDESHVQAIGKLIDTTVTELNASGVFGKPGSSNPAAPPVVPAV